MTNSNIKPVDYEVINHSGAGPYMGQWVTCPHCMQEQRKSLKLLNESKAVLSCRDCKEYFTIQTRLYYRTRVTKLVQEA